MSASTPGPWFEAEGEWICTADGDDVCTYAGCGSHTAYWPNPADYKLAMASPELLATLQEIVEFTADVGDDDPLSHVYVVAMRAVAKATGA